jgi:hypothetical protein
MNFGVRSHEFVNINYIFVLNRMKFNHKKTQERFLDMTKILPEGEKGCAKVVHFEVSEQDSAFTRIRAIMHPDEFVEPGRYAQLKINGRVMMSNTLMEKSSNTGVINNASGHVLIAGLGIGLILPAILAKKEVLSVTVIEKYREVIDLVEPHLRSLPGSEKLHVIEADIFTWKPEKGKKYDTIYFDIWPNVCTDNLYEIATLHRKYARCKTPNGWIDSWKRNHLKRQRAMGY